MNDYVKGFLQRNSNPSPPLPNNTRLLEQLRFWPEDTDNKIFVHEETDLRALFLRIQKKWPEVKMEEVVLGIQGYAIVDSRHGEDPEIFVTLEKV